VAASFRKEGRKRRERIIIEYVRDAKKRNVVDENYCSY
jgi:hypothetical protein